MGVWPSGQGETHARHYIGITLRVRYLPTSVKLVQVKVSEEAKGRWSEFVEETNGYNSVSELVRRSVEAQISREVEDTGGDFEEFAEQFEEMLRLMNSVKMDLDSLRMEQRGSEELYELMVSATEEGVQYRED